MLATASWARSGPRPRPTSASRACSTASARSSPRSWSRSTATATPASGSTSATRWPRSRAACPACAGPSWCRSSRPSRRPSARSPTRWSTPTTSRRPAPPPAFAQLPFDHPLYILYSSGTTGQAEGDRARRRRHAAPAPQGAPAAHRPPAGRPRVLLHHLRLDDVELAGRRARRARRRWSCSTARRSTPTRGALGLGRARSGCRLRHQRQVHRRAARRPARAGPDARLCPPARDALDRLAAGARELRLRLRGHQADVQLASISGGTDIVSCFVLGNPAGRSGAARSRCAAWAWRSRSSTRASPFAARRASWSAPSRSPACRSGSGTTRTAPLPRRLLRALPGRLEPRRLRRDHRARRHRHPRPLGRVAQPRRRADRHRRDLPPGRADPRGARRRSASARTGRATCGSCCSCGCARARPRRGAGERIKGRSAQLARPRHVPARIVQVADIPRTRSGKITELAVRDVPSAAGQEHGGAGQPRGADRLRRAADRRADLDALPRLAWRRARDLEQTTKVTEAEFTFVALTANGRPRPVPVEPAGA